jgi:hypothetical protein
MGIITLNYRVFFYFFHLPLFKKKLENVSETRYVSVLRSMGEKTNELTSIIAQLMSESLYDW